MSNRYFGLPKNSYINIVYLNLKNVKVGSLQIASNNIIYLGVIRGFFPIQARVLFSSFVLGLINIYATFFKTTRVSEI